MVRKLLYVSPLVVLAVVAAFALCQEASYRPAEPTPAGIANPTDSPAAPRYYAPTPAPVTSGTYGASNGFNPYPSVGSSGGDPRFNAMGAQYNQVLSQNLSKEEYAKFLREFEATVHLARARAALLRARKDLEQVEQGYKDTKAGRQAADLLKLLPDKTKLAIQDPFVEPMPIAPIPVASPASPPASLAPSPSSPFPSPRNR